MQNRCLQDRCVSLRNFAKLCVSLRFVAFCSAWFRSVALGPGPFAVRPSDRPAQDPALGCCSRSAFPVFVRVVRGRKPRRDWHARSYGLRGPSERLRNFAFRCVSLRNFAELSVSFRFVPFRSALLRLVLRGSVRFPPMPAGFPTTPGTATCPATLLGGRSLFAGCKKRRK